MLGELGGFVRQSSVGTGDTVPQGTLPNRLCEAQKYR